MPVSGLRKLDSKKTELLANPLHARISYGVAVLMCVLFGLSSRYFGESLPSFIYIHAGDASWASMVYFGFRFFLIKKSQRLSLVFALLFSFLIEFSQTYQATWINAIRSTMLGALILGSGFLWIDLIRYTIGIFIAWLSDCLIFRNQANKRQIDC